MRHLSGREPSRRPLLSCGHPGGVLAGLYLWLPSFFLAEPWDADTGYCRTLFLRGERPGHAIEFDRAAFISTPEGGYLDLPLSGERIALVGVPLGGDASLSVRGVFVAPQVVDVAAYRVEPKTCGDVASYLGLIYIGLSCMTLSRGREVSLPRE